MKADAIQKRSRCLERAEVEREHPAEPAHLLRCERVLRMGRQAGVVDAADLWMPLEKLREGETVRIVLRHPQRQRLRAAEYEPRVERTQDRTLGVLHEP